MFAGATLTVEDDRQDYGEDRFITIGILDGRMVILVGTPRKDIHRIISMRKANKENKHSTHQGSHRDDAPDLSGDGRPEEFAKATVRRGRPPIARPKVSTTIRLSPNVIDYFKLGGRGWQTGIDQVLREWVRQQDTA